MFELRPLRMIDVALEDRILDALSVVETRLRHPVQALSTGRRRGRDVIRYENEHATCPRISLPNEGGIRVEVAPQVASQEPRL